MSAEYASTEGNEDFEGNVRDASNSLDFSWVDEIDGLHLLDDGA